MRLLLIALLLPSTLWASGKKPPPAAVSFHLEASASEAPKFARRINTVLGPRYFRSMPIVSTKDIVAFSPFPADDQKSYGLAFKLSPQAARRLQGETSLNRGKLVIAIVNRQPVGVVRIDKPVTDGILIVWKGIKLEEIRLYDQLAPRIGESPKKWKERLKKMKKRK